MAGCKGNATLCRSLAGASVIAGVVFSCLSIVSCDFVKRGISYGLFSYRILGGGECIEYDGFVHGWLHTWAAVCGALAPVLGAIVFLFMILDCFCEVCCSQTIKSTVLSGAELSQGFTFLLYASDACIKRSENNQFEDIIWGGCKIGQGSIYSWVAFGCYFISGCFFCLSPKHKPIFCQKDNDAAEKPKVGDEKQEQVVIQDEENAPKADPQSPPEEVKPQVY